MVRFFGNTSQSKPKHMALHQRLGIPLDRKIPESTLRSILATPIGGQIRTGGFVGSGVVLVDTTLKYQANFALNTGQEQQGGRFL